MTTAIVPAAQRHLVDWDGFIPEPIEHADDVWFSSEAIGRALEYPHPRDSINQLFRAHRKLLEPYQAEIRLISPGGPQSTRVFNEEGVILLCLKSRQPKAIAFQRWAAAELKARRLARVQEVGARNRFLEDRVTYLTTKLLELHERHERTGRPKRYFTLEDAERVLTLWKEGFRVHEIAGLTEWSSAVVSKCVHGQMAVSPDAARAYPHLKSWPVPADDPRKVLGRTGRPQKKRAEPDDD